MDLLVDLIDHLIEERIRIALADPSWDGKNPRHAIILKEKIRRILIENIETK